MLWPLKRFVLTQSKNIRLIEIDGLWVTRIPVGFGILIGQYNIDFQLFNCREVRVILLVFLHSSSRGLYIGTIRSVLAAFACSVDGQSSPYIYRYIDIDR
jgi:hypothetical protein